jgi:peroxiredoxin
MIVLKGLFDTYYSNELPRPSVVQMLDQMILNAPSMEAHSLVAEVKERITALMEGSPAPDVKGFDLANTPVSLANFRGKYIYLDFFSVSNYACIKDFELLGYIQSRFFDTLVVVSVSMDPLPDDLDDYLSTKEIPWQVIRSVDVKEAAEQYQLVALPAYFLIAPDGKFVMSPAPAPTDRFEEYFARYLERRKQF